MRARSARKMERLRCHEQTTAMTRSQPNSGLRNGVCGLISDLSEEHKLTQARANVLTVTG